MRISVTLIFYFLLSACGSVEVPVAGQLDNGEAFEGYARASMQEGIFMVTSTGGYSCKGEYDQFSRAKRLYLNLACSNGLTGDASIIRDNDLLGGQGTVELSNGQRGTIVYGDEYVE